MKAGIRVVHCALNFGAELMRKHDFYSLPRSIQDRFIESSQAVAAPMPLAVKPTQELGSLYWGAGAFVCSLVWGYFLTLGYGELRSELALSSVLHKGIHVLFATAFSFCLIRAYLISWGASQVPYGSGHYLFPSGAVTARGARLFEFESTDVESASAQGKSLRLKLRSAGVMSFATPSSEEAAKLTQTFQDAQAKWLRLQTSEPLERARLCPLMESGVPNPLAPTDSYLRPTLLPPAILSLVILGVAAVLGIGASTLRDSMSRKALYRAATEENTVSGYLAYIERGGEREEVKKLLLPRAELQEAINVGTVDAIEGFKAKDPELEIGGEVQNALRAALLKELEAAIKTGTLSALDEVPKRFISSQLIAGELAVARQNVFNKALTEFHSQASDSMPDLLPFVQRLVAYSQTHGPTVQLQFVHEFPQTPEKLDQVVAKSKKYYMGRKSLPTQYFIGEPARRREKVALEKMQKRLQAVFPKDILDFTLGPPPAAENVDPPEIKVPTLTFSHRERLSGGFVGGKPKAMYLGAAILMGVEGSIPGEDEPMVVLKWNAWRAPNFTLLNDKKSDIPDIYEEMMGGTFDSFIELYLGRWFKEP